MIFRQRSLQRRLAAGVLLAWLFALLSGVVNACVVEPALVQGLVQGRLVAQHEHVLAAAGQTPAPHTDDAPCIKFCEDSSSTAPTAQQTVDRLLVAWAPPPSLSLAPPPSAQPADQRHDDDGALRVAVPIPIAFLRLAL